MNVKLVLREAISGLGRNVTMTLALTITTAISLALISTGLLSSRMADATKEMYLARSEVMVQLNEAISTTDSSCRSNSCQAVLEQLRNAPGVKNAEFLSRAQAWERFVDLYGYSEPELVNQASPALLPAGITVRLADPLDLTPLDAVRRLPQVTQVVDQADVLRGAVKNLDGIRFAMFALAVFQVLAAVFLIVNMVQIAAFSREKSAAIMRMVGASRIYTEGPFVAEAVLTTLFGGLLASVAVVVLKNTVVDKALADMYQANLLAPLQASDLWLTLPLVTLSGAVVAGLTALLTLRAYVRK